MASVYTESVVTLNSSQAEATMNALKASADELRKKMIEATKLGNTDDAAKYQKQLDQVNKSENLYIISYSPQRLLRLLPISFSSSFALSAIFKPCLR